MNKIAHASGCVDGMKYSNSLEALKLSIDRGFKYIEVDVIKLKNSYAIAHDGMEKSYNTIEFSDLLLPDFLSLKVYGKYTPLSFSDLEQYSDRVCFIFDTKFKSADELGMFSNWVRTLNFVTTPIFQVYSFEDANLVRKNFGGGVSLIFALWKNYGFDSLSDSAINEIAKVAALDIKEISVSISFVKYTIPGESYFDDVRFKDLESKYKIIFHNVPVERVSDLSLKFNLFLD